VIKLRSIRLTRHVVLSGKARNTEETSLENSREETSRKTCECVGDNIIKDLPTLVVRVQIKLPMNMVQ
jgi:hypothetical protein